MPALDDPSATVLLLTLKLSWSSMNSQTLLAALATALAASFSVPILKTVMSSTPDGGVYLVAPHDLIEGLEEVASEEPRRRAAPRDDGASCIPRL